MSDNENVRKGNRRQKKWVIAEKRRKENERPGQISKLAGKANAENIDLFSKLRYA